MINADKVLSEGQLNRLLKRLKVEKEKSMLTIVGASMHRPKEIRIAMDYFLFTLIAYTGLRISEALSLESSDIHEDFLIVRAEISKNGKKGSVYFGKKSRALLDELKAAKPMMMKTASEMLFSVNGKVATRCYMHIRFKFWLRQTELPAQLSIHSLRHTYGTLCLDKGLSLTFVRDNLRHSNISITSQYLHLTQENRDRVRDLF